jgi:hypothetical protein
LERLLIALKNNFGLEPKLIKKKGYPVLHFPREEFEKLIAIIKPHVPDFM